MNLSPSPADDWKARYSPEAIQKRKKRQIIRFGCLPAAAFVVLALVIAIATDDSRVPEVAKPTYHDPLKIGIDSVRALVAKPVPTANWKDWGEPETIDSTNLRYWVFYLKKANISMVVRTSTDTVEFADFERESALEYFQKKQQDHKELVEKQFSSLDGSHPRLTRLIKKAMNDPDSYEHDETVYWDMEDYLVVRTSFRGRNAFGGMVRNYVKAKVDFEGNVLEIIEEGP